MHWSNKYIGAPWKTGGRSLQDGLDCWGLLIAVYVGEFGIAVHDYDTVTLSKKAPDIEAGELTDASVWKKTDVPGDGDAVVLGRGTSFHHVGVYVANRSPHVLHCERGASVIQELRYMQAHGWTNVAFYRHVDRI